MSENFSSCAECNRCPIVNFKDETIEAIENAGLTQADILWIGGNDFTVPIEEFWALADFAYNRVADTIKIPYDLIIMLNGGCLYRDTKSGVEWWEFLELPEMPNTQRSITRLCTEGEEDYPTLADLNP